MKNKHIITDRPKKRHITFGLAIWRGDEYILQLLVHYSALVQADE